MGQRDSFSENDINKLNSMYCRSGHRPVIGTEGAAETINQEHAATERPAINLWNVFGSLVNALSGNGGR